MSDVIIPANRGFWQHWLDVHLLHEVVPIIGWRVPDNGDPLPIVVEDFPTDRERWDNAIEYPDGSCIDDGGTYHRTIHAWLAASRTSWNEAHAEDQAEDGA